MKALIFKLAVCFLLPLASLHAEIVSASPQSGGHRSLNRHPDFVVPAKMRPRVEFWIDIFSKYGKNNMVIHHRMYPHIVFEVLDFEREAQTLSEGALKRLRSDAFKRHQSAIQSAMKHLAAGRAPSSALEERIAGVMSVLGPGPQKYNDVIKEDWIRSQTGIRERYAEAVQRSGRYLHLIEKIFVEEYGLPVELTRLPFVESSFDYAAYSSVGAAGIWQFMPRTGRLYDMKVDRAVDERRDVVKASHGAARYLLDAYRKLGTWPLALTSYNHGIYGVERKVKQLGTRDIARIVEDSSPQPFGFASQNFYPEFLAALEIYDNIPRYFPGISPHPKLQLVRKEVEASMPVSVLASHLGIPQDELQAVNYALLPRVWKGQYRVPQGYILNIPANYSDRVGKLSNVERRVDTAMSASSVYGGVVYQVRSGDSLGRLAKKFGTSVSALREMNNLSSDSIRVGQRLVVSERESAPPVRESVSTTRTVTRSESSDRYTVQPGDTLYGIARKFAISVSELRRLNGLSSSRIKIGQSLIVGDSSQGDRAMPAPQPMSRSILVRKGDSLWSLSRKYGVAVSALKQRNKLKSNKVTVGQRLHLP